MRDNPKYCTTLGFIPKTKLTLYAGLTSWKGVQRKLSNHTWSMDIFAVWNKEAKQYDVYFQPPAPDGNAYTHLYWLAAKDTDEKHNGRRGASTPRLCAPCDVKVKLKTEVCKSHRLVSAKTDTKCSNYWKYLRPLLNKPATNISWNNSNHKFYEKHNVMRYRIGTILNEKQAFRYGFFPNANCPICHCTDSALIYSLVANTLKRGIWL